MWVELLYNKRSKLVQLSKIFNKDPSTGWACGRNMMTYGWVTYTYVLLSSSSLAWYLLFSNYTPHRTNSLIIKHSLKAWFYEFILSTKRITNRVLCNLQHCERCSKFKFQPKPLVRFKIENYTHVLLSELMNYFKCLLKTEWTKHKWII